MGEVKEDYLEVDDPINGQSYVCLSFVSPEDIMQNREAFNTAKFLQSVSKEQDKDFKYFYNLYTDFCYKYSDKLQGDFDKENDLKTNVRGVKVRGVYQTEQEARRRAKSLQSRDSSFNVFIGPVGYWLPWNPCADKVQDEEFMNEELNNMIKKYKENEINKDKLYEEEKRNKVKQAMEKNKQIEEENQRKREEQEDSEKSDKKSDENTEQLVDSLQEPDPWMQQKSVEQVVDDVVQEISGDAPVEDAPVESVVDAPVESVEDAPVESVVDAPVESVEDAPVESVEDAPVESVEDAPIKSEEDC
jgi:hypothetical protein